ncbi:MAG TPA: HD domain-containing protein [Planctomycetaceae bacterium]
MKTPAEPRIVKLSDLAPGEAGDLFALLAGKERGTTRDGKPYYRLTFRDAARSAAVMVWHDSPHFDDCEARWKKGGFFKLRGRYSETSYGPQLDLDRVRPVVEADAAEGFDPDAFFPSTRFDADAMYRALVRLVEEHVSDLPLRRLVLGVLSDHESELLRLPGEAKRHHVAAGGFVEHVLSVARTALFLADKYAEHYPRLGLSKDLVVAGAVLHDIGKLAEIDPRPEGSDYTPRGRLIGHVLLGRDLVRDKAREIDGLDPEVLLRLEHVIVSHHDLPESGSPVPPSTPEALIVHHADTLDAKLDMMATALASPNPDGDPFTTRDNPLRRPFFRGLDGTGR